MALQGLSRCSAVRPCDVDMCGIERRHHGRATSSSPGTLSSQPPGIPTSIYTLCCRSKYPRKGKIIFLFSLSIPRARAPRRPDLVSGFHWFYNNALCVLSFSLSLSLSPYQTTNKSGDKFFTNKNYQIFNFCRIKQLSNVAQLLSIYIYIFVVVMLLLSPNHSLK